MIPPAAGQEDFPGPPPRAWSLSRQKRDSVTLFPGSYFQNLLESLLLSEVLIKDFFHHLDLARLVDARVAF